MCKSLPKLSCIALIRLLACAGLFPDGRPNFRSAEELKLLCKSVDPAYKSLIRLSFPEDYDESQERCKQIACQLAERHKHENILLVGSLCTVTD